MLPIFLRIHFHIFESQLRLFWDSNNLRTSPTFAQQNTQSIHRVIFCCIKKSKLRQKIMMFLCYKIHNCSPSEIYNILLMHVLYRYLKYKY